MNWWLVPLLTIIAYASTFYLTYINSKNDGKGKPLKRAAIVALVTLIGSVSIGLVINLLSSATENEPLPENEYNPLIHEVKMKGLSGGTGTVLNKGTSAYGDERNFVSIMELDSDSNNGDIWEANEIKVKEGKTYRLQIYVHNGTEDNINQVRVTLALSKEYGSELYITGYLEDSTGDYWNSVKLFSDDRFYIDYVEGSAKYQIDGKELLLPDNIITGGVYIGSEKLDGVFTPDSDGYVTVDIKPIFTDQNYIVENNVRHPGTGNPFYEELYAAVGDKVEFQIHYKNTTEAKAENVTIIDTLPSNLILAGDVMLYTSSTGNEGKKIGNITEEAQNIGSYAINGDAYVRFSAEVVNEDLIIGRNILRNWVQVSIDGESKQDPADVIVEMTDQ